MLDPGQVSNLRYIAHSLVAHPADSDIVLDSTRASSYEEQAILDTFRSALKDAKSEDDVLEAVDKLSEGTALEGCAGKLLLGALPRQVKNSRRTRND